MVPDFERTAAWARAHPFRVDLAGAVLALLLALLLQVGLGVVEGLLLPAATTLPLAWRRTRPVLMGALLTGAGLAQLTLVETLLPSDVAALVGVYSLAAYGPPWASAAGLLVGLGAALLAALVYFGYDGALVLLLSAGTFGFAVLVAWALGSTQRVRLKYLAQTVERARLLEVEREQEARLAATAERQRIAREMHDVVAHSLSVMVAQADGGRYAAHADPSAAAAALQTVSDTGRQALTDMRSLLGVLREASSAREPQPDVGRLPQLVDDVRRSGLDVDLAVEGQPRPLPPGLGLAAYRIVQEGLTNVLKHAGPSASAEVRVRWGARELVLEVTDDGRGAGSPPGTGGSGLRGMHERVRLHGGRVEARPQTGGGFQVRAVLPYEGPA